MNAKEAQCAVCHSRRRTSSMVAGRSVRASLREELAARCGGTLGAMDRVCMRCIFDVRNKQIVARLSAERGALSALETEVARKAASHETIAQNLAAQFRGRATFGERMADGVARIGGSWVFVGGFAVALVLWMIVNSIMLRGAPFDPYPYILLNLVLSTLAAIQAPVIMMSQNRASSRDRMQADEDFRVNLKAEIEVAALHEKIDHLLHEQWESLLDMQQAQLELLEDLGERVPESKPPRDSA